MADKPGEIGKPTASSEPSTQAESNAVAKPEVDAPDPDEDDLDDLDGM